MYVLCVSVHVCVHDICACIYHICVCTCMCIHISMCTYTCQYVEIKHTSKIYVENPGLWCFEGVHESVLELCPTRLRTVDISISLSLLFFVCLFSRKKSRERSSTKEGYMFDELVKQQNYACLLTANKRPWML